VPIEVLKTRKGEVAFDTDEHPKQTSAEALAGLRPGLPQGRLGHGGQRQRHQRRRRGGGAGARRCGRGPG
jgi:hypothetical protein